MKSTFRKIDPFWVLPYLCKVRVIVLSLGKVEFGIWMKIPFSYSNPIMKTILCDMASSTIAACAQKVLIGTGVCNGLIIGRKGAGVKWTSDPRGPFSQRYKGAFNIYVNKIWSFFYHLPTPGKQKH